MCVARFEKGARYTVISLRCALGAPAGSPYTERCVVPCHDVVAQRRGSRVDVGSPRWRGGEAAVSCVSARRPMKYP
jgi:hypothetical protein